MAFGLIAGIPVRPGMIGLTEGLLMEAICATPSDLADCPVSLDMAHADTVSSLSLELSLVSGRRRFACDLRGLSWPSCDPGGSPRGGTHTLETRICDVPSGDVATGVFGGSLLVLLRNTTLSPTYNIQTKWLN